MGKENKEIIKFAKKKLEEAKRKLYVQEIIQESIKEYEKHREVYLKNEWTYEDIGRAMANIMIVKVKPPICAVGSSDSTSENSFHKHIVIKAEGGSVCDCDDESYIPARDDNTYLD